MASLTTNKPGDFCSNHHMGVNPARIRFTCQPGCTNCCEQKGYVYLTEADVSRAAAFLGLSQAQFEKKYIYRTQRLIRLRKPAGSQCHFLKVGACGIHPAKPTQCRTFPFWPDLFSDKDDWKATKAYCPGIGIGDFVPIAEVERSLSEMREADED
jgi:Fe-S-cluster containining protein